MRLVGRSTETLSQSRIPIERYYHCTTCENEWTYNVEKNVLSGGVPAEISDNISRHNN